MIATTVGSYPGSDADDFAETVKVVLGELDQHLPHLPELPGRGAGAAMIGRTLGLVTELDADLQPAGWRLTGGQGAPALDQRRARSLLGQDLDVVEEHAQEYAGPFKVQVVGPWTLAATVERPRGDKVLADHGARRDLAQALAEGVREHVADVRRRLPRVDRIVVQVDEPALPAVLSARVPTASGFGKHRSIDLPEASAALEWVLNAVADTGAEPWVHSCAAEVPWDLVRGAGAAGLSADLERQTAAGHDQLATALESGATVALGVVPSVDPGGAGGDLSAGQVAERVLRWLDMLGLDPDEVAERLVVTPACGLAGALPEWARRMLGLVRDAARELTG